MKEETKMINECSLIERLVGNENDIEMSGKLFGLDIFSDIVCDFLSEFSLMAIKDKEIKKYPDALTFAFFCRKANINELKKKYKKENEIRKGRGLTFHVAPSNIPVNFAYSMMAGLLAGNACIVRVSSKKFIQIDAICRIFNEILIKEKYIDLKPYINIVRYSYNDEITGFLSSIADIRVIWGGDETISKIRRYSIKARSFDITFANRYSVCIIKAQEYIGNDEKKKKELALKFYNDTYLFDCNACSSPTLIYWLGKDEDNKIASEEFWKYLYDVLKEKKYQVPSNITVNKYLTECRMAIDDMTDEINKTDDNNIVRIKLKNTDEKVFNYRTAGGVFFEGSYDEITQLSKYAIQSVQTLTYFGVSEKEIMDFINKGNFKGVDRVVPIGKALEFDFTWDGYDLISTMSRNINLDNCLMK